MTPPPTPRKQIIVEGGVATVINQDHPRSHVPGGGGGGRGGWSSPYNNNSNTKYHELLYVVLLRLYLNAGA